jgi:hypothetical protein
MVRAYDLVNYMLTGPGQAAVARAGYVPVPQRSAAPFPDVDVDLGGTVGLADLGQVTASWGQTSPCPGWIRADVNNDGAVGLADLGRVIGSWTRAGFLGGD